MYYLKIVETIQKVEKEKWDSIVNSDSIQMSYEFLESLEKSQMEDYCYYYILIYNKKEQLCGGIPIFTIDFHLDAFFEEQIKKIVLFIRKYYPKFLKMRALFIGCLLISSKISLTETMDKTVITELLLKKLMKFATKSKLSWLFLRISTI